MSCSKGVYISFVPVHNTEDEIVKFDVFLVNYSHKGFHSAIDIKFSGVSSAKLKMPLEPMSWHPILDMDFDQLNDRPEITVDLWLQQKLEGKQNQYNGIVKTKAKSFFSKWTATPLLDIDSYLYPVITDLKDTEVLDTNRLKKVKLTTGGSGPKTFSSFAGLHNLSLKANLKDEIDLHIEKLTDNFQKLDNYDILQIQLKACDDYLKNALICDVSPVYLIHGVGKGKLKEEVHRLLRDYSSVKKFSNDYHPKYGFGATEVVLG